MIKIIEIKVNIGKKGSISERCIFLLKLEKFSDIFFVMTFFRLKETFTIDALSCRSKSISVFPQLVTLFHKFYRNSSKDI